MKILISIINVQIFSWNYCSCKFFFSIPVRLSQAYESFRRFLHSENTRSDASVLVISHCIFHWDVTVITSDKPFLVLCEIFQLWCCQLWEEPYCNFPFQKSRFLSTAIEWFVSEIYVLSFTSVKLLLKIHWKFLVPLTYHSEVGLKFVSLVDCTSLSQIMG